MAFRPRNAYYLRISKQITLPLFLYLDERHIDWMSDVVLQHILADLRPLVIPKLQAEKDIHFGPGAAPASKRGTVEVHRGETYQFAYFFRKTEPHSVVFKSRHFVTAPVGSTAEVAPRPAPLRSADQDPQKKRSRNQVSAKQSKRKRGKAKGKDKIPSHLDEDEWSDEETDDDMDVTDHIPGEPRPVRKQRRITVDMYQEDDEDDTEELQQDVTMNSPSSEAEGESSGVTSGPQAVIGEDAAVNQQASLSDDSPDIELVVEEEEKKPKPLLKLKYQSFPISGHCLCVVVEPWPPFRTETEPQSIVLGTSRRPGGLHLSLLPSDGSVMGRQRAETPLFFPEDDRAPSEAPFGRERTLPPVPLFQETFEDEHRDDDIMIFSQALNAAGHMHAITADDDDDMEGAILFGDADEVRELL